MGKQLFEHQEGTPVPDDVTDGTEDLLGDDTLDTDWDLNEGEIPPPGFWTGTHNRDGSRIPGFTEAEYLAGDAWDIPEDDKE